MKYMIVVLMMVIGLFARLYASNIEFNDNQLIKIKQIENGSSEGDIKWDPDAVIAGGVAGPGSFTIGSDGNIYIPDRHNRRINVYNSQLEYIKTITEEDKGSAHFARDIQVDENQNIIAHLNSAGLKVLDKDGKKVFDVARYQLPDAVNIFHDYFMLDGALFYYDDAGKIQSLDSTGKKKDPKATKSKIKEIKTKQTRSTPLDESVETVLTSLENGDEHLVINNKLYSRRSKKMFAYYKEVNKVKDSKSNNRSGSKKRGKLHETTYNELIEGDLFKEIDHIGFDSDHNSYWSALYYDKETALSQWVVIIFSQDGLVLDIIVYAKRYDNQEFIAGYPDNQCLKAVSPSGDIYVMDGSEDGIEVYKVTKSW